MEEENEHNSLDGVIMENGETKSKTTDDTEETAQADTPPPEVESPQPMECDKMNGGILPLGSPVDNPPAVVSPDIQNISHIETSNKEIKHKKQVLNSVTPADEEQIPSTKPKSKKSKKSKNRCILPTVSTNVKANQVLCEEQELPEGMVAGSTSLSPLSCTEYAQYLGLQPTVKFKCFKCSETGFSSINKLKEHQNLCLKSSRSNTPDSSTGSHFNNPAQNLRITRKVYMCSSCGTYFENWNLYLHMREVHRRHVCLLCLGMFMHAEKLALHLSSKHNTTLEAFATPDDFSTAYPSSTFLTCCTCERIFSEQDNFFEHHCGENKSCETKGCAMCGLEFAHTSNCPHADNTIREKKDTSVTTEKTPPLFAEPGTSKQTAVQDTLQDKKDEEHTETTFSIPNNLPVNSIAKPVAKKRVRQRRPKKSAIIEDEMSKEPSPKLKPTCLRIKLAPVSRKNSRKLIQNCTNIDDSSDIEELPSPDLDLNDELEMLADDTSNPPTLQNGERSPSMSPPPVESLDANHSNKAVDTGQRNDDSEAELEKEEVNGDSKIQEVDDSECAKADNISVCSDSEPEHHNDLSAEEDMEVDQDVVDATEAESSMSEHDETEEVEKQITLDDTRESLSDHNESDDSLDNSDAKIGDSSDSIDKTDSNILNQNDPIDKVDSVNEIEKVGDDSLDENNVDANDDDDDEDKDEWQIDENSCKEEDEATEGELSQNGEALLSPGPIVEEEEELQLAGEDSPLMDLVLESSPDQLPIQTILKQAIQEACDYSYCVYCTHARKIAVNGKQLAIHLLSEHRYQLIVNSERLACEKFIDHVKEHMKELETSYFNCDTYDSLDKENVSVFVKSYECFQCRFVTKVHKDLYLHNRKMHQKNGLVCIMCKSNFYSYSELLCHLCPGIYNVTNQPLFRCCFCSVDNLPSSFRFMVHVRKRHQACDVCLEFTGDQQKLSNHVWKHKLHHYCYRCGIAYRNKPDITKHLFWKHGTESVLCKRCLQKKWPYVYHFCIPPSTFTCEECNASFSRAVALKVHKRLHTNDLLYPCELCNDSFISRKLLARHDRTIHNPPPPEENLEPCETVDVEKITPAEKEEEEIDTPVTPSEEEKEPEKPAETTIVDPPVVEKKVVDVYDLPPLNLSSESEDESDTEETKIPTQKPTTSEAQNLENASKGKSSSDTEQIQDSVPQAVDSVWENFKDYKSSKDSKSTLPIDVPSTSSSDTLYPQPTTTEMLECVMFDHDYFGMSEASSSKVEVEPVEEIDISGEANASLEHNYCNNNEDNRTINEEEKAADNAAATPSKKKQKSPKKKHKSGGSCSSCSDSDSSSSDSSSSSCSCGTNCSCSSSSSSSSGSSSSDSSDSDSSSSDKDKKEKKKARRRERAKNRKDKESKSETVTVNGHADMSGGEEPNVEDIAVDTGPPVLFFHESDLDTNESETDEDFYDEHPRLLMPNRNLLLLSSAIDSLLSPQATPAPTPPPSEVSDTFPVNNALLAQLAQEESVTNLPVKSSKSKKRKRSLSTPRRENKLKITIPNMLHNQLKTNAIPKLSVQKKKKYKVPPLTPVQLPSIMSPTFCSYPVTPATPQYGDSVYSPAGSSDIRGSGSETDNVRLSKRRRVPKKFYGDSSDEEGHTPSTPSFSHTPQMPEFPPPPLPLPPPPPPPPPLVIKPHKKKVKQQTEIETTTIHRTPTEADMKLQAVLDFVAAGYDGRTADDEDIYKRLAEREKLRQPKLIITLDRSLASHVTPEEIASSSSEEEEEEEEEEESEEETAAIVQTPERPAISFLQRPIISNRHDSVKLYCYCQCPYDEVSEMIACDGKNCAIEWFHFECVGITVPPKGKWYCPDCRKRYNIAEPLPNPQYFYNASSEYMMSSTDPTPSYTET